MLKIRPQVYKTFIVLLKNQKVNHAVLKNNELLQFEELPISIQSYKQKFGNAHLIKSIYKEHISKDSIYSQYAETKENNLIIGILVNHKKKTATAIAKSVQNENHEIKLIGKIPTDSELFNELFYKSFSNLKRIFQQVPNYYVTEKINNSVTNISVVKNPDCKFTHPNTFFLKKDGKITEFGKLWGCFKQI